MDKITKVSTTIELGPITLLFLTIVLLATLKVMGYIGAPWYLILSPLFVVVVSSAAIILFTIVKMLKNYFFN